MNSLGFPCTKCGCCCMNVGHVTPLISMGWVDEDGVCKQYDRGSKTCRVYDERPMVCRIDEGRPVMFTASAWTLINLGACNVLHRKMYGVERELDEDCRHVLVGEE